MNPHPYLRAYLAGVFVPALIMPLMLAAFIVLRLVLQVSVPIERGLIFPMALVPSLWGLWNMLWLGSHKRTHLAVGVHGAVLPLLLLPTGAAVALSLNVIAFGPAGVTLIGAFQKSYAFIAIGFCIGVAAYYLVWKYIVGSLNRVLDIA
jgi:hypothetical protein